MIEVGHPFSRPFQGLVDSLKTSLQFGVEQPDTQELLFRTGTFAYPLKDAGAVSGLADQITGFVAKKPAIFTREVHYVYAVGQLVWQPLPADAGPDVAAAWFPDDNSRLTVGYFFRDLPSGITDFNEGSVAGTLVRAMAREFKLIYEQIDQAYRRAFIDHAQGFALDNVVALLGISRNPEQPAQGEVTFWLKKPPKADVAIATGTRVADPRGRLFKVTAPGIIRADAGRAGVDGRHRGAHQPADRRPRARARDRDHGRPRDQADRGGKTVRRRRAHRHARGGAVDHDADRHLPAEESRGDRAGGRARSRARGQPRIGNADRDADAAARGRRRREEREAAHRRRGGRSRRSVARAGEARAGARRQRDAERDPLFGAPRRRRRQREGARPVDRPDASAWARSGCACRPASPRSCRRWSIWWRRRAPPASRRA